MDNRTSYNRIARQWADSRKDAEVSRLVVDFADKVPPNGHILDLGCGTGLPLAKYLCERGFRITGIDAAEELIAMANSLAIKGAEFIAGDFLDFVTAEKFDGILAWDSLWHFPKAQQRSLYPKLVSLLQPNGYLLFTHGNVDDEHVSPMMGEPFYYSALSEEEVRKQLSQYGLDIDYAYNDFIEGKSHRSFVVLAKKSHRLAQ
jgi:2-polyprenyl-3-methyl-5-hydroxy-6-metoxy-1,4-benzoquinol methylase